MRDIQVNRPTLGPFMSVVCFRYLNDDAMELAGSALVIDAGRQLGSDVIEKLGVIGSNQSADEIFKELDNALGVNGTRLCLIQSLKKAGDGGYEVVVSEYTCSNYTMGVLIGAISAITSTRMRGELVSETKDGTDVCVYHIEPV